MEKQIYSILDDKAQLYSPPFIAQNDGIAIRMVMDILRSSDNNLARYPTDHKLVLIGIWDDINGEIMPVDGPPKLVDPISKIKQLMEQNQ
jgi:hypothetical protein